MKNYFPKPIKGLAYAGHVKISHAQVIKYLQLGNKFEGFLVGNKVNSFHFFGGWYLACRVTSDNLDEFNKSFNSFNFYLEPELGNRPAIYLKVK